MIYQTLSHDIKHFCVGIRSSPQTAGGVTQQQRGLELDLVFLVVRGAAPARVGDDDRVDQRGQSVADDGHLHRVARRKVPQDTCG